MTEGERLNVRELLGAVRVGEWVRGKCPRCSYSQARGHKCSCPVRIAIRNLSRSVGVADVGLEDDDLIVERALMGIRDAYNDGERERWRDVIRAAVDAAVAFGRRA